MHNDLEKEIKENSEYNYRGILAKEGEVLICYLQTATGESRTARVYPMKAMFKTPTVKAHALYQLKTVKLIQNANCFVKMETHFYTASFLVMVFEEYFDCSLDKLISEIELGQYLPIIFKDLIDALILMRENKLIHTMISPRVIYIMNGHVKLGGLEYVLEFGDEQSYQNVPTNMLPYLGPEAFLKSKAIYPSQIFSLGMILYELLFKKRPFPDAVSAWTWDHYRDFYERTKIFDFTTNDVCSDPVIFGIAKECLKIDYPNRITLRYLQEVTNDYIKSIGSILTLRKRAVTKSKEGLTKKNFERLKSLKTSSMISIKKCKLISPDEDPGRPKIGHQQ